MTVRTGSGRDYLVTGALVPPRIAAALARRFNLAGLWAATQSGPDIELHNVVEALLMAAESYRRQSTGTAAASVSGKEPAPPAEVMRRSLTTSDVAGRLGVGERRVTQLINDGQLAATKVGRQWLVTPEALEDYEATRRAA